MQSWPQRIVKDCVCQRVACEYGVDTLAGAQARRVGWLLGGAVF